MLDGDDEAEEAKETKPAEPSEEVKLFTRNSR